MSGIIIGTTFLYDYTANNKGRLIVVVSQHEIDSSNNEEETRGKVQQELTQKLHSYLSSIQLSEDEKESIRSKIEQELFCDLKESSPETTWKEIQTILLEKEFQTQINQAVEEEIQQEKQRILSNLLALANKYTQLNKIELNSTLNLLSGNKQYNAQIQLRLSRYIDQIKEVIEQLVRFNQDTTLPKTKTKAAIDAAIGTAIAHEFTNLTEVIFISPCNIGYPHECNQNALILREPKAMHNIVKALREHKNNDFLVKCIWTTHNWSEQDNHTLERAKEAFEDSERKESEKLQTTAYRSEHHFYSPRQIERVLKNLDQWWKEGLVPGLRIEDDATEGLASSAQNRFSQLKARATHAIRTLGSKKTQVHAYADTHEIHIPTNQK